MPAAAARCTVPGYAPRAMSRLFWSAATALALPAAVACGARTGFVLAEDEDDASTLDAAEDTLAPEDTSLPLPDDGPRDVGVDETGLDARDPARADVEPVETGREATVDAPRDVEEDRSTCRTVGVVVSDIFGATVSFAGGKPLPAGRYVLTWVDGCMRYSGNQGWTVNAYASSSPYGFTLVDGAGQVLLTPPGTSGVFPGQGAYATFPECVAANARRDAPIVFDFAGGPLGVHLVDDPYTDNEGGPEGRNPTWRLDTGACADD